MILSVYYVDTNFSVEHSPMVTAYKSPIGSNLVTIKVLKKRSVYITSSLSLSLYCTCSEEIMSNLLDDCRSEDREFFCESHALI